MASAEAIGRFCLIRTKTRAWVAHDRLLPCARALPAANLLQGDEPAAAAIRFRLAFLPRTLPPALRISAARPRTAGDPLFWQFPARTEASAFSLHAAAGPAPLLEGAAHTYLAQPWATFIDLCNRHGAEPLDMRRELFMQRVRIGGFHRALRELGGRLRVHTVCQHVYWRQLIPTWSQLGVTDVWLSHAPSGCVDAEAAAAGLSLHPWRLYAVNWEDESRREGLRAGIDPSDKPLLASFVGAHADHYLSDVRLRLRSLADEPGFHVQVTEKWHFEDLVYHHQVYGRPLPPQDAAHASMLDYNRLLSDSRFALCPAGAGPNTLRLWEALAIGSVPVLLGPMPELPRGGTLPDIDWDRIVLRAADEQIAHLPARLRAMPLAEVRQRQALGLAAFAQVQAQLCFPSAATGT